MAEEKTQLDRTDWLHIGFAAIVAAFALAYVVFGWRPIVCFFRDPATAAWVQALGSIAAIWAAFRAGGASRREAQQVARTSAAWFAQRVDSLLAEMTSVADVGDFHLLGRRNNELAKELKKSQAINEEPLGEELAQHLRLLQTELESFVASLAETVEQATLKGSGDMIRQLDFRSNHWSWGGNVLPALGATNIKAPKQPPD